MNCVRCNEARATLQVRQGPLCETCFSSYIENKVFKHIDILRQRLRFNRGDCKKLLVAFSGGKSSTMLLDLLAKLVQKHREVHKTVYYEVFVAYVESGEGWDLDSLRQRYPNFTMHTVDIQSMEILANQNTVVEHGELRVEESNGPISTLSNFKGDNLDMCKKDILGMMQRKLLISFARSLGCIAVLYGDCMSKLAQTILSSTAQGRGGSLARELRVYQQNDLFILRPLREVLDVEVQQYVRLNKLDTLITDRPGKAVRSTTIDELMREYLQDVHEKFPAIASTIMSTVAKLEDPSEVYADTCALCEAPCTDESKWLQDITVQGLDPSPHNQTICYGCLVMARGLKSTQFPWIGRQSTRATLDQYIIS